LDVNVFGQKQISGNASLFKQRNTVGLAGIKPDSKDTLEPDYRDGFVGNSHLNKNIKSVFLGHEQSRFSVLTDQNPKDAPNVQ
jgi:hypothetical protein